MKIKYLRPPLVEAVCEFRFDPSSDWDMAIPGLIYEKVKRKFPKRNQIRDIEVGILATEENVSPKINVNEQLRFLRDDEKEFLAVKTHFLSINKIQPYTSWSDFLPSIKLGFDTYRGVADPKGVQRIGLRYINRIEFGKSDLGEKGDVDLDEYFEFRPHIGKEMYQDYASVSLNIEQFFEDNRDILRIQLRSQPSRTLSIFLDFDYFLARPEKLAFDAVFDWIECAHRKVYETFEACITERLRKKFEPEK